MKDLITVIIVYGIVLEIMLILCCKHLIVEWLLVFEVIVATLMQSISNFSVLTST
jgi:hypothetical protein